ncbi:ATP-binding protein [Deltaproteobacteria bacterium TL4]
MKQFFQFNKLKTKLTLWFLGVALLPLLTVSTVIYYQRVASIKAEAFRKLTAIRDLKIGQINNWLDERIGDMQTLSEYNEIKDLDSIFSSPAPVSESEPVLKEIRLLLNRYVRNYKDWSELLILNPVSGKVEVSSSQNAEGQTHWNEPYFTELLKSQTIHIQNIYYSKTLLKPIMTLSIPLYGKHKEIMGLLVGRVDLESSLYRMLLDRTGMGNTGETLIVNKDSIALNELMWDKNAPLRLKIKAKPAVMASQGGTGIIEAQDYRNIEVLAAYSSIPRTQWGFVAKQDQKEIYAPIAVMIRDISVLLLGSIVIVYLVSFFTADTIARSVLKMTHVSRRMQAGELSARNVKTSDDELGELALAFNKMADELMGKILIQQGVAELAEALVRTVSIEEPDFIHVLIEKIHHFTDSYTAVFYLFTHQHNNFEPLYAIGAEEALLKSLKKYIFEAEMSKVLVSRQASHLKNIPYETTLNFKSAVESALPKEVFTFPVLAQDQVLGGISISTLNSYTKNHLELLSHTQMMIHTQFSNLWANENTIKLAIELSEKNLELEHLALKLQNQSNDFKIQNRELELQRSKVEEANRLKSEFLSNISHEFKTPLNSIMALSRALLRKTKDKLPEKEIQLLEVIERNGKQLLAMINDILELAKIDSGKLELKHHLFQFEMTLQSILENIKPVADEKNIELTHHWSSPLPMMVNDEQKVHQILQNIIGNAVKFTMRGSVDISVAHDAETMRIQVKDSGIGIPKEEIPYIFEEFRQVDGSLSRPFEGAGLGLAIAYKAAKVIGGDISVESEVHQGTLFTIRLPLKLKSVTQN